MPVAGSADELPPATPKGSATFVTNAALVAVLGAVLANLLFNALEARSGATFPYTSFLFQPDDRFGDFFKLLFSYPGPPIQPAADRWGMDKLLAHHWADAERLRGTSINHFHVPPVPTLLALGSRWLIHWLDPVLLFVGFLIAALVALFGSVLRLSPPGRPGAALATVALLSYPTLFAIDRGHFFSLICATLTISATLRTLRDGRADRWSILMFAVAINVRPNVGIVPLALLIGTGRFRFREAVQIGLASIALFAGALAVVHSIYPAYTLESFQAGLQDYSRHYIRGTVGFPYGSSIYGALRSLFGYHLWTFIPPLAIAAALFAFAIVQRRRGVLRTSEFLFLVLSCYALGSQIFGDYHLLVFIIPLVLLAQEEGLTGSSTAAILIGSVFVLAPKNYQFEIHGILVWSRQVVANPMVLLTTSIIVLIASFRRTPEMSAVPPSPKRQTAPVVMRPLSSRGNRG